jgi:hypothetical protein
MTACRTLPIFAGSPGGALRTIATTPRPGHRSAGPFTAADVRALDLLFAGHRPGLHDVALLEQGEPPRILGRTELADHLSACGLGRQAKVLRRTWAAPGQALLVTICDDGLSVKSWPLEPAAVAVPLVSVMQVPRV